MVKRLVVFCIMLSTLPLLSGCWFLVGGAVGYEVSPDSVRGHFDTSFIRAYSVSLDVMRKHGKTTIEDEKKGWIKADFDNYNAAVHIEQLTERTVQITISARKYALPKPQFARDILSKISRRLK